MLFQAFPCERNPWAFHCSDRNDMERNDCVPVWTGPKTRRALPLRIGFIKLYVDIFKPLRDKNLIITS